MDSRVYLFLSLVLYAFGAVHVFVHALTRRRLLSTLTLITTLLAFAAHTAALLLKWGSLLSKTSWMTFVSMSALISSTSFPGSLGNPARDQCFLNPSGFR